MTEGRERGEGVCLTETEVLDHVRGESMPATAARVERHIAQCEGCLSLVAEAAKSSLAPWSSSRVPTHPPTEPSLSDVDTHRFKRTSSTISVAPLTPGGNDDLVGQLVARRFRMQRLLGSGGMGRVYQAYDELLKVRVAMKLILPDLARQDALLRMLYRELVVARRVNHPNVCRVYDIGQEDGLHFITMELIRGDTLDEVVDRGAAPAPVIIAYLTQIAVALEAAHAAGVIHRDLKPANIMVDGASGHVTVMDFGLARDLVSDQSIVRGPVGTPAYWSPEQARGDQVTPASDVFAFGLVALRAFGVRSRGDDKLAKLPPQVRDVVARCLREDAEQRYPSGRELREALQAMPAAAHEAHEAPVDDASPTEEFRRPQKRGVLVPLLVVGLVGACAGAWALVRAARSTTPVALVTPSAILATVAEPPPTAPPPPATALPPPPTAAAGNASALLDAGPPPTRRIRPGTARPDPKPPAKATEIPVLE